MKDKNYAHKSVEFAQPSSEIAKRFNRAESGVWYVQVENKEMTEREIVSVHDTQKSAIKRARSIDLPFAWYYIQSMEREKQFANPEEN